MSRRPDPPLPEGLGKAFIQGLMKEFAKEKRMTLEEYLQDSDQRIAVEENYLDAPPQRKFKDRSEDLDQAMREDYADYRDNKRWLDEV